MAKTQAHKLRVARKMAKWNAAVKAAAQKPLPSTKDIGDSSGPGNPNVPLVFLPLMM